jgi:hypothetical protein
MEGQTSQQKLSIAADEKMSVESFREKALQQQMTQPS